jgi:hypothetical protein
LPKQKNGQVGRFKQAEKDEKGSRVFQVKKINSRTIENG